jgi:hypothetical protein
MQQCLNTHTPANFVADPALLWSVAKVVQRKDTHGETVCGQPLSNDERCGRKKL